MSRRRMFADPKPANQIDLVMKRQPVVTDVATLREYGFAQGTLRQQCIGCGDYFLGAPGSCRCRICADQAYERDNSFSDDELINGDDWREGEDE